MMYQFYIVGDKFFRVNPTTGETWVLVAGHAWAAIAEPPLQSHQK